MAYVGDLVYFNSKGDTIPNGYPGTVVKIVNSDTIKVYFDGILNGKGNCLWTVSTNEVTTTPECVVKSSNLAPQSFKSFNVQLDMPEDLESFGCKVMEFPNYLIVFSRVHSAG